MQFMDAGDRLARPAMRDDAGEALDSVVERDELLSRLIVDDDRLFFPTNVFFDGPASVPLMARRAQEGRLRSSASVDHFCPHANGGIAAINQMVAKLPSGTTARTICGTHVEFVINDTTRPRYVNARSRTVWLMSSRKTPR